jgi:sulfur carrier protein
MTNSMITIQLNGEKRQFQPGCTIDSLLDLLDMSGKRLAVEINQVIIPRSRYSNHTLKDSDVVEIVQAIGGG